MDANGESSSKLLIDDEIKKEESTTPMFLERPRLGSQLTRYSRSASMLVFNKKETTAIDSIAAMISDRIDLEPLNEEAMIQAQRFIDETQPLKHVPIKYVLPFLQKCCCKLPGFLPNATEDGSTSSSSSSDTEEDEEDNAKDKDDMEEG